MYKELLDIYAISTEDTSLVEIALTHPSYTQVHNLEYTECYERLEFLGDSFLKLAASEILYKMFPEYTEGNLSKIRSFLVSDNTLAEISLELGLHKFLRLAEGEEKSGGRTRISNNACAFEALLGAFYLLHKEVELKAFLNRVLTPKISSVIENFGQLNAKEILQEYTQGINKTTPIYEVVNITGPDHAHTFEVSVSFNGEILAYGSGNTKKTAQINAAYQACKKLEIIK